MIGFVLGAATGYVLGARAGRERYEQIVRTYQRVTEHPAVQSAAGVAREKVSGVVNNKIKPLRNGWMDSRPASTTSTTMTPTTTSAKTPPTTTSASATSATTSPRSTSTPRS
jgi:hypothetical protein